jgi:hypothetical protein
LFLIPAEKNNFKKSGPTMNFFGGSKAQESQGPDPVFAAKTEFEMYTGENNKIRLLLKTTLWTISQDMNIHSLKFSCFTPSC